MATQSDVYELRMGWSIGNVPGQTTWHIAVNETGVFNPRFRAIAVELAWFDHFALPWFFSLPSNTTYRTIRCGRVNNGGGPWFRDSRLVPGNPSNPRCDCATICTGVVCSSNNAGRWITKRLRFPGISESAVHDNRISNVVSGRVGIIAGLMLSSWNYAGVVYECVAWSRHSGLWSHLASVKPINQVQPLKSRRPGLNRKTRW